jgi:DNA repair photolyase
MVAPVIPGLTDSELEPILAPAARAAKVMARVREVHGGRDYDPAWGKRMRGEGVWSDLVAQRFAKAVARRGLDAPQPPLRSDLFRVPPRAGDQLSLF